MSLPIKLNRYQSKGMDNMSVKAKKLWAPYQFYMQQTAPQEKLGCHYHLMHP
jgi:hypothetical protein